MARSVELVYDRLVAQEKLRSSDKYERLAAIVFFLLAERATIHDLRLRGRSGVKHQIDVVVGHGRKRRRVLIECKNYETKIGLPLVRNFYGAVEDIEPQESFVLTTVGFTRPAIKYAEAKGIRLAILRPPEDEADWGNLVRRIDFELVPIVFTNVQVQWEPDPADLERAKEAAKEGRSYAPDQLRLRDADGGIESLSELWERITSGIGWEQRGEVEGTERFAVPRELLVEEEPLIRVTGLRWTATVAAGSHKFSVGHGIGGLTAELALRTLDGDIHRIFSNRQIAALGFDNDGNVVRREQPRR